MQLKHYHFKRSWSVLLMIRFLHRLVTYLSSDMTVGWLKVVCTYIYIHKSVTFKTCCRRLFWCSTFSIHSKYNTQVQCILSLCQLVEHITNIYCFRFSNHCFFSRNTMSSYFKKLFSGQNVWEISSPIQIKTII